MDARKEQYRRIRGAALKFLAKGYPGTVDAKILFLQINELGLELSETEFNGHLAYLEEKEFVRRETRSAGGISLKIVRITTDGLDLLDGYIKDIGVDTEWFQL